MADEKSKYDNAVEKIGGGISKFGEKFTEFAKSDAVKTTAQNGKEAAKTIGSGISRGVKNLFGDGK